MCKNVDKISRRPYTIPRRPYGHRANLTIFTSHGIRNPQSQHVTGALTMHTSAEQSCAERDTVIIRLSVHSSQVGTMLKRLN